MKSATVKLSWPPERRKPLDEQFARANDVKLETVRYASPCQERQFIQTVGISGNPNRAKELLAECESIREFNVVETTGYAVACMKCRTTKTATQFLMLHHKLDITVDWPIYYLDDRPGFQIQIAGEFDAMQAAVEELPDLMNIELVRIGEYKPAADKFVEILTQSQRNLLSVAYREGYFEVPRETTQDELAQELGIAPGTISERLQRIEAKLVNECMEQERI